MEEGFYEVDVNTLEVKELYQDGNNKKQKKSDTDAVQLTPYCPEYMGKDFIPVRELCYLPTMVKGLRKH